MRGLPPLWPPPGGGTMQQADNTELNNSTLRINVIRLIILISHSYYRVKTRVEIIVQYEVSNCQLYVKRC